MSFDVDEATSDDGAATTLAVVVEAQRLAAGLVDQGFDVVVRDRIATPSRDVWYRLERMVRRVLAAAPRSVPPPTTVAVTCTGPIDTQAGSVSPPSIPAWSSFPLRERLAELSSLPVVLDSLAGAAADARRVLFDDTPDSFVEVLLDGSVDSACVVGGTRLRGAHGNAGSIAHVVVEPDGARCSCGALGCAEVYLSSRSIEAEINRPIQRVTPSIVERSGIMLGRALASLAATVDVDTAYVSGSLVETLGAPLLVAARTEIAERARLANVAGLSVESVPPIAPLVAAAAVAGRPGRTSLAALVDD